MPSPFDVDKTDLMRRVLDYLNVRYKPNHRGWQKVSCPSQFHSKGDRRPSASVNLPAGIFHCHACPLRGDGFSLMMDLEGTRAAEVPAQIGGSRAAKEASEWLL